MCVCVCVCECSVVVLVIRGYGRDDMTQHSRIWLYNERNRVTQQYMIRSTVTHSTQEEQLTVLNTETSAI